MVKDDGSVSIHNNEGIKPLNYMGPKSVHTVSTDDDGVEIWSFDSSKESLSIHIERIYGSLHPEVPLGDPGLQRDGTESQLQEWLSHNLHVLVPGLTFTAREQSTEAGPVDIMATWGPAQQQVVIEVKRVATRAAVYQVHRYLETFNSDAHAMIIALDVRPGARALAAKKGFSWLQLDWTDRDNAIIEDQLLELE